jgi:molecular chaperone DnaK (HSP70)
LSQKAIAHELSYKPRDNAQAVTNPQNTVYATKRLIGRSYDDEVVAKEGKVRLVLTINSW